MISYDDFAKLEIRIGTVIAIEEVPNSEKLYDITIDLGNEQRHILTGMKPYLPAEVFMGKQLPVLCNLEPRKMAGRLSEGMILAADNAEGVPVLLSPLEKVASGSKVR